MYEVITIVLAIMLCYAIYKYNIKNKHLTITILDKEQTKKALKEEIVRLEECIKIKNQAMQDSANFREKLDQENIALRKLNTKLESTMESTVKEAVSKARKESIKRQRSILKGQATEHLAPYIKSDYNPKDYRFFGDPVDFIIFEGMHNFKETKEIKKVIFMDIKTGTANLTTLQRRIRDAIKDGRVEFQVYNPEKDIENKKEETQNGENL